MSFEGIRVIGTYSCYKGCPFCYQATRTGGFLSASDFQRVLEAIDFVPIYFTFQGGELHYFQKETFDIIDVADKMFPQVFRKSLTTNGYGDLAFYTSLKRIGITHFSISLHEVSVDTLPVQKNILQLKQSGFFTVRVNCFLNEEDFSKVYKVIEFCAQNDIQLTLCEDLRLTVNPDVSERLLLAVFPDAVVTRYRHQSVYWVPHLQYKFWVYKHLNHYDYNNLIVLPDGTTTDTFDDVQAGCGNK